MSSGFRNIHGIKLEISEPKTTNRDPTPKSPNIMNLIKNTRDHPGHLARALPLAAVSDIPNVITPRKPLRRLLTSIALPLAALGLGQLVPCAQADVLPVTSGLQCWYDASVGAVSYTHLTLPTNREV